jgi:hypothetical protein
MEAQGASCQRAWAYMRDANGGNALSKLARYETSLLREYDRSRQELEKLQKIRAARPTPPPITEELRRKPDPPITPIKSAQPEMNTPEPDTRNQAPSPAPAPEPTVSLTFPMSTLEPITHNPPPSRELRNASPPAVAVIQ